MYGPNAGNAGALGTGLDIVVALVWVVGAYLGGKEKEWKYLPTARLLHHLSFPPHDVGVIRLYAL
jgi:hypothetical protein